MPMYVKSATGWEPWSSNTSGPVTYNLQNMMLSNVGTIISPVIWRGDGDGLLWCWLDHWRRPTIRSAYAPIWGLRLVTIGGAAPVSGSAAFRCTEAYLTSSYVVGTDRDEIDLGDPLGSMMTFWVNNTQAILSRHDAGTIDGSLGGGIPQGSVSVSEYRWSSAWGGVAPGPAGVSGYWNPNGTNLNPSDLRGNVSASGTYSRSLPLTAANYLVTG